MQSLTHALLHLAARPELIAPLREEIDPIVAAEGWTAASVNKMEKLDSFLRESQRHDGVGMSTSSTSVALFLPHRSATSRSQRILLASMIRKAMKDVTLNDGTVVPEGTLIHAISYAMHHSDEYYPRPDDFDPFRFSRMREAAGECGSKYQFASTAPDYIPFGHGQFSWYVSRPAHIRLHPCRRP